MLSFSRHRSQGAAMLEFHIVALFALLPLCLGVLQIALLLAENHHIDHAAFIAARHGAVAHGDLMQVRRAFVQAATVLFVQSGTPVDRGNVVARVATAYTAAVTDVATHARIRLLTPTVEAQSDFAIPRNGGRVIPNDSLEHRNRAPGRRSGISVQEANILRVEINYCRPLIVPFAGPMIVATLRLFDHDLWHQRCYAAGRVPLRAEGTAPMQSDFRVTS